MNEQMGIELKVSKIYQELNFFKKFSFLLSMSNLVLAAYIALSFFGGNLVIMKEGEKLLSFEAKREQPVITQNELKKVAESFIKRRFEWEQFNLNTQLKSLSLVTTEGLQEKILAEFRKDSQSFKSISQYVGKIELEVLPSGEIRAKFDKVLRLTSRPKEGDQFTEEMTLKIPVLSETQLSLKVVSGDKTLVNPLGLYVNSVAEYEVR